MSFSNRDVLSAFSTGGLSGVIELFGEVSAERLPAFRYKVNALRKKVSSLRKSSSKVQELENFLADAFLVPVQRTPPESSHPVPCKKAKLSEFDRIVEQSAQQALCEEVKLQATTIKSLIDENVSLSCSLDRRKKCQPTRVKNQHIKRLKEKIKGLEDARARDTIRIQQLSDRICRLKKEKRQQANRLYYAQNGLADRLEEQRDNHKKQRQARDQLEVQIVFIVMCYKILFKNL